MFLETRTGRILFGRMGAPVNQESNAGLKPTRPMSATVTEGIENIPARYDIGYTEKVPKGSFKMWFRPIFKQLKFSVANDGSKNKGRRFSVGPFLRRSTSPAVGTSCAIPDLETQNRRIKFNNNNNNIQDERVFF